MTDRVTGVFLLGDLPPGQIATMSQLVEAAGFTELWFAEDYFMLSAFATAGIALQATKTIKVGIGAIANPVRHPAVAAMEATTLLRRSGAGTWGPVLDETDGPCAEIRPHVDDGSGSGHQAIGSRRDAD
jgi:hypothetical protein